MFCRYSPGSNLCKLFSSDKKADLSDNFFTLGRGEIMHLMGSNRLPWANGGICLKLLCLCFWTLSLECLAGKKPGDVAGSSSPC